MPCPRLAQGPALALAHAVREPAACSLQPAAAPLRLGKKTQLPLRLCTYASVKLTAAGLSAGELPGSGRPQGRREISRVHHRSGSEEGRRVSHAHLPAVCAAAHAESGRSVIFTETTTHGSLPWTAEHNRRALLCTHTTPALARNLAACCPRRWLKLPHCRQVQPGQLGVLGGRGRRVLPGVGGGDDARAARRDGKALHPPLQPVAAARCTQKPQVRFFPRIPADSRIDGSAGARRGDLLAAVATVG